MALIANQSAKFIYTSEINGSDRTEFSGKVCASLPGRILLTPYDPAFASLLIEDTQIKLIDFRLEQVTNVVTTGNDIKKKILHMKALNNFCYKHSGQNSCIQFLNIKKSDCTPTIKIPNNFEIMEG